MSGGQNGDRGRRGRRRGYGATGFEDAGGYMAAKIAKLQKQYELSTHAGNDNSQGIFRGIAIFVNGYTEPTGEELKRIMMVNGGTYHHYYSRSKTTHIIASNLPDTKVKNMNTERIVNPKWITDSLSAGRVLDYTKYLLYTNQSGSQPKLPFKTLSVDKTVKANQDTSSSVSSDREVGHKTQSSVEIQEASTNDQTLNITDTSSRSADNSGDKTNLDVTKNQAASRESPTKGHSMSTANPKFLSEFYNNSRLHHISTMGAIFKQYVNEIKRKGSSFPGRKRLMEWLKTSGKNTVKPEGIHHHLEKGFKLKSKRVIMHIDMDCFFVSVGLRKHPHLRGLPVAVTHAKGNVTSQAREGRDRQYELNYYKERAEKKLMKKMKPTNQTPLVNKEKFDISDEESVDEPGKSNIPSSDRKFSSIPLIDETSSLSEIASCSYEARKAGVKNGMFLGPALKLCPSLQTIPYDFEGYKEVSYKLYDIVASFTHDIEAVSCDEMFIDLTELLNTCQASPEDFASLLRSEIQAATGCPCSAGMGPNMLITRMATRLAKPNGQHLAIPDDFADYMKDHKVSELPGVGWSLGKRLESEGVRTCKDMQAWSLGQLQTAFGSRTGQSLYNYCRGIDDRPVKSEHMRKSVSAEVNYGIRFTCVADAEKFIGELAAEVANRLSSINLKGKCITLKLKVRAKDAPVETAKFMGHGVCDNVAKSVSLSSATCSSDKIERETLSLLRQVKAPPQDFRGVGIQVSRLEGHQGSSGNSSSNKSVKSFFLAAKTSSKKSIFSQDTVEKKERLDNSISPPSTVNNVSTLTRNASFLDPQPGPSGLQRTDLKDSKSSSEINHTSGSKNHSTGKGTVDLDVLMALPENLRNQVISEYEQQGYTIPCAAKSPEKVSCGVENNSESFSSLSSKTVSPGDKHVTGTFEDRKGTYSPHRTPTNSESLESEDLITSFSQVDSSFLDAIPAELREELRQDFEHKKQAEASRSAVETSSGTKNRDTFLVPGDAGSREKGGHGNKVKDKRGRPGKLDPRNTANKGLTKLTNLLQGPNNKLLSKIDDDFQAPLPLKKPKGKSGKNRNKKSSPKKVKPLESALAVKNIQVHEENGSNGIQDAGKEKSEHMQQEEGQMVQEKEEVPHLCGVEEIGEVKALIREWVTSCPRPEDEDAEILSYYYTNLIVHRELEKLDLLIKYLLRQIKKVQNTFWEKAFQNVLSCVQKCMLEHHNAKLKIENL
ncbi:DNA repair protein REV1-like [Penaeus chinensis]|uniref:DNA repair protein REV1-like n=1 Tax=Penaeus chinensis TaxID=139456 RepID=UPI001FB855E4|nr:DNA repair protein REV1-like [Penaeus chinensis]